MIIKNLFLSFMVFVMTSTSFAQVSNFNLEASLSIPKREEHVTKTNTTELVIKERFREESFVLKGEAAKHQGYILTINDRKAITSILQLCETSCGTLVDKIGLSCDEDIDLCQKNCNNRISLIEQKNEELFVKNKKLVKKLENEERKKVIFTSIATFVGVGFGAFIVSLKN